MGLQIIVYLIYDMTAKLSPSNVEVINQLTELNFDDVENVTYQILIDARKKSRGSEHGYKRFKNGKLVYVLPSLPMGMVVDPNSAAIKEVSEEDYINIYEPTFDPLPEID